METTQQDNYKSMAWYYRELIRSTGRLDNEIQLILNLFQRTGIHKQSRILDFACGTGDILSGLNEKGFENLFGLDGSPKMIERAKELKANVSFSYCQWRWLETFLKKYSSFDFAFALSISLPHIDEKELKRTLINLRKGLKKGGGICFDFRAWERSHSGRLIEPNRPEGVFFYRGGFYIGADFFWVDDRCYYDDSRQYVEYRIRKRKKDGYGYSDEQTLTVSYALLEMNDYIVASRDAGFDNIEVSKPLNWPYLVLTATVN